MTLAKVLSDGKNILKESNIADYDIDAWLLLSYITGLNRQQYLLKMTEEMDEELTFKYNLLIKKRANRIPLQYITGTAQFYGRDFVVSPDVLIPRFDTEVLIETALAHLQPGASLLDVCTGSGCILLTLMSEVMDIDGVGIDISVDALRIARENATKLSVSADFREGDLFAPIDEDEKFDLIVSNPPYIASAVIETLDTEVKDHEPRLALDGSEDGLIFYQRIIRDAADYMKKDAYLIFEIGYDQGEAVSNLLNRYGFTNIFIKKDLNGLDRVVGGQYVR